MDAEPPKALMRTPFSALAIDAVLDGDVGDDVLGAGVLAKRADGDAVRSVLDLPVDQVRERGFGKPEHGVRHWSRTYHRTAAWRCRGSSPAHAGGRHC